MKYSQITNRVCRYITLVSAFTCFAFVKSAYAADLNFSVEGLEKPGGQIVLLVYSKKNSAGFPSEKGIYDCKQVVAIEDYKKPVLVSCSLVDFTEFAVFVFHDANSNGVVDHNFIGIPKEQLGFSGGCKIRFGPPKYSNCAINNAQNESVIPIQML